MSDSNKKVCAYNPEDFCVGISAVIHLMCIRNSGENLTKEDLNPIIKAFLYSTLEMKDPPITKSQCEQLFKSWKEWK